MSDSVVTCAPHMTRRSTRYQPMLGHWPLRIANNRAVGVVLCLLLLALGVGLPNAAAAITEWALVNPMLAQRTASSLTRYYTEVKPQKTWVRYIARNSGRSEFRLRSVSTANDTLGELISLRLGQFRISSTTELRVALGDDLYAALLLSRNDPMAVQEALFIGDQFTHDDWLSNSTGILSLDRLDYRVTPSLGLFVGLGAPESNQSWWNDGSLRSGVASPEWEFAILAPLASGGSAVGPLRERRVAPGWGAAGMVRLQNFTGRARFTGLSDAALNATQTIASPYVHSLSLQGTFGFPFETPLGAMRLSAGAGYEEYAQVCSDQNNQVVQGERVRRFSPVGDLDWVLPNEDLRFSIGVADLSLRGSFTARLTNSFYFQVRAVSNNTLRKPEPFEHPFTLFLTPIIKW